MKAYVLLFTALILICVPATVLGKSMLDGNCSKKGPTNSTFDHNFNSTVQVSDGRNRYATVALNGQLNLECTTVDSSTLVNPPPQIKNKIDSNLLNLTGLMTKGYLQNNQTDIIMSVSNENSLKNQEENGALTSLTDNARMLYTSKVSGGNMNFLAAHLNYTAIFELAENSQITHIWLDREFQMCLNQSVSIIKDPAEWVQIETSYNRSIDGSGLTIAILDTGIDSSHPDFYFSNGTSKIAASASFTGESIVDRVGHGTHVASIAAGTGAASQGQYTGVAPNATLLNVKVLNNHGAGTESWIISGIQWAVDNNASIINMSFGSDTSSDGTDPLSTTVNWATQQGVVCVVAAGNSGPTTYAIGSPGAAESAITVGASTKDDVVAGFSSAGPTDDNRIKPDVVAPGVDIVAARAAGTNMGTPVSQYYTMTSGTSMAAPHVAGAAALLLNAHPSWTPFQVKMALANYAKDLTASVLRQGSGRIDVYRAVTASILANASISFGTVNPNETHSSRLTLQNIADSTLNVTLDAQTWNLLSGTNYHTVSLTSGSLTLSAGTTDETELDLNTSVDLPGGFFEGIIIVTFNMENVRIPFFFDELPGGVHDVSVIKAVPSKTVASGNVTVDVTVTNQGDYTETFSVTAFANTTTLGTTQTTLTSGSNATLTFTWGTTSFPKGNYTLSAIAPLVPNETKKTDSPPITSWVFVTINGDVDGDFKVGLTDLQILAAAYDSKPGDTNWNPNVDVDNSGTVNLPDLFALSQHYGQHYP
jgi:subtilisin family serine protease